MYEICEEFGCRFESRASWPSGPNMTTVLRVCVDCESEYEMEVEDQ